MVTTTAPRFIFPPRPQHAPVERANLDQYSDWLTMLKFNDKRTTISYVDGKPSLFSRQGHLRRDYRTPDFIREELMEVADIFGLEKNEWSYLDGGLLHHKSPHIADTIVIWDILVKNSQYLLGTTYQERYNMLLNSIRPTTHFLVDLNGTDFVFGHRVTEHIFVPHLWDNHKTAWDYVDEVNIAAQWNGSGEPTLEGVIMKDPNGVLAPGTTEKNNNDWSVRSRVRTGRHNY